MPHLRGAALMLIALAAVVLAACGRTAVPERTPERIRGPEPTAVATGRAVATVPLRGSEWALRSLMGKPLLEGTNVALSFAEGDEQVVGFAGCNHYGGRYEAARPGVLKLSQLSTNTAGCVRPLGILEQEAAYIRALRDASAYRVAGDRLEIEDSRGDIALVFAREKLSATMPPLDDTEWELRSLKGDVTIEGQAITIGFSRDQLGGDGGCNNYSSVYLAAGNTFVLPEKGIGATRGRCEAGEGVARQEAAYIAALNSSETYRVTRHRLELADASGDTTLVFTPKQLPSLDPALGGATWLLQSLRGKALVGGTVITLGFNEGWAGGHSGCNGYGGEYGAADAGALRVHEIGSTDIGCETPVLKQEERYIETLRNVVAYRATRERLELRDASGETTLAFTRKREFPMDPAELVGTRWKLLSFKGESPARGLVFTIAFTRSGISGRMGCRSYTGIYRAEGDDIHFPELEATSSDCMTPGLSVGQEDPFSGFLSPSDYRLGEKRLEILNLRGEAYIFAPLAQGAGAAPPAPPWELRSFIERGRSTPVSPGTRITLAFGDGTLQQTGAVNGALGCGAYTAAYIYGEHLSFETPRVSRKGCREPAGATAQGRRFLRFLEDVADYRRKAHELRLLTRDGRALVFVAPR